MEQLYSQNYKIQTMHLRTNMIVFFIDLAKQNMKTTCILNILRRILKVLLLVNLYELCRK